MQVGIVRVTVHQARVAVRMVVRLAAVPGEIMFVPMMFIVQVGMGMLDRPVDVPVLVPLRDMEPYAERHQYRSHPERRSSLFAQHRKRKRCAEERRNGKVRRCARGAEPTQRDDEEHQADAITEKTHYGGWRDCARSR